MHSLSCFGLRLCNAVIDLGVFETVFWQAIQSVRIMKRKLSEFRYGQSFVSFNDKPEEMIINDIAPYRDEIIGKMYAKPYETPLEESDSIN